MTLAVNGRVLETDAQGYLRRLEDWDEDGRSRHGAGR